MGVESGEPTPHSTVTLTTEESQSSFTKGGKDLWWPWETKGVKIQQDGNYDEALYCLNQAQIAGEKSYKDGESNKAPTDTYLQKAYLYLRRREPQWAARYADRFEAAVYRDKNPFYIRAFAYYELGQFDDAVKEASRLSTDDFARQIVEGLETVRRGDVAAGRAAVTATWTDFLTKHSRYPQALRPDSMAHVRFLTWPELPSTAQRILSDAGLDPDHL